VAGNVETVVTGVPVDESVKVGVAELIDSAARVADEMVVVAAVRELVADAAVIQ
jgi:hypothetical protein